MDLTKLPVAINGNAIDRIPYPAANARLLR